MPEWIATFVAVIVILMMVGLLFWSATYENRRREQEFYMLMRLILKKLEYDFYQKPEMARELEKMLMKYRKKFPEESKDIT